MRGYYKTSVGIKGNFGPSVLSRFPKRFAFVQTTAALATHLPQTQHPKSPTGVTGKLRHRDTTVTQIAVTHRPDGVAFEERKKVNTRSNVTKN